MGAADDRQAPAGQHIAGGVHRLGREDEDG